MKDEPSGYYIRRWQSLSAMGWLAVPTPVHEIVLTGYETTPMIAHRPYKGHDRWFVTGWQLTEPTSGYVVLIDSFPSIAAAIDGIGKWLRDNGITAERLRETVEFQIKFRGISPKYAPKEGGAI